MMAPRGLRRRAPGGAAAKRAVPRRLPLHRHLDRCPTNLLVPVLIPQALPYQSDVGLFACYWLVAAVLFWTRRSPRAANLAGLDVCLVDMPFTFLLQADVMTKNPGAP